MSKHRTLTHDEREQIKKDYLQVFRLVWGKETFIEYRRGWWYLGCGPMRVPFSTKEIETHLKNLRWRLPHRADSEEDSFQ